MVLKELNFGVNLHGDLTVCPDGLEKSQFQMVLKGVNLTINDANSSYGLERI